MKSTYPTLPNSVFIKILFVRYITESNIEETVKTPPMIAHTEVAK